jgi:hypothetical protein
MLPTRQYPGFPYFCPSGWGNDLSDFLNVRSLPIQSYPVVVFFLFLPDLRTDRSALYGTSRDPVRTFRHGDLKTGTLVICPGLFNGDIGQGKDLPYQE